jgi:hypothetical protein
MLGHAKLHVHIKIAFFMFDLLSVVVFVNVVLPLSPRARLQQRMPGIAA